MNNCDNHIDDHVEDEIQQCFNSEELKCFFTFAGAGSGKTRSLVNTLNFINKKNGKQFLEEGKKIAVITYTNAACEEIKARVEYSQLFQVSTIHSFLWDLVRNYQKDIKDWLKLTLQGEVDELEIKEMKSSRSSTARIRKIEQKRERIKNIQNIFYFTYNPNGQNSDRNSLSHAEVIKLGSYFIENKELLQKIIICQYPVLLIDESQDTKKELIDALLSLYNNNTGKLNIGMFGDSMQRIYNDGKTNLSEVIPNDWVKPLKKMNHRSSKRVVILANSIRKNIDNIEQKYRTDANEGHVYLFIKENDVNKIEYEKEVCKKMNELTGDGKWLETEESKKLILEHHMAASRLGFIDFFSPLYNNTSLKDGVLDGTISEIKLFIDIVIPVCDSFNQNDKFTVSNIVKKYSPLLSKEQLEKSNNQLKNLKITSDCIKKLVDIANISSTTGIDLIKEIISSGIFHLPSNLKEICEYENSEEIEDEKIKALFNAFSCNYDQIVKYSKYILEETSFATHQGVKGLEFPRVVVIMSDEEARGFLFSYEKLFGATEVSQTDIKNEQDGRDSSITRTTRLFYVACTRAEESLAIIAYTKDVEKVTETALENGWFKRDELIYV